MVPSSYQQAIFDLASDNTTNFHVEAIAGSGKTTTLVNIAERSGLQKKFLFTAFSKIIATELGQRLPNNICSTLHSLGYGILRDNCRSVRKWRMDKNKYLEIFRAHLEPVAKKKSTVKATPFQSLLQKVDNEHEHGSGLWMLAEGIGKMMITMTPPIPEAIEEMAEEYNIDLPLDSDEMAEFALRALQLGRELAFSDGIIDFNEMLYYPAMERWNAGSFHTVGVDEVQDLNKVQQEVLSLIRKERIITVGDKNQSIFGFAGAMSDSVEKLKALFKLKELPLSICYRCGKDIVRHAQSLVPHMEYNESNPDGIVREIYDDELIKNIKNGAFILCRLNAPLVSKCFSLLTQGVAAKIRGKDIADSLIQTIHQLANNSSFSIENFSLFLDIYYEKERGKIYRRGGRRVKMLETMLADKVKCLDTFYNNVMPGSVNEFTDAIKKLFVDNQYSTVTLMSCHKAKGLEADQIFIIEPNKLPLCLPNQTEEEMQQERNLLYVARTRAKLDLVYVHNRQE